MPTMRKGSPMVYPGIIFQCHSYAYAAMLLQYGVSLLRRMMRLAPPSPPPGGSRLEGIQVVQGELPTRHVPHARVSHA